MIVFVDLVEPAQGLTSQISEANAGLLRVGVRPLFLGNTIQAALYGPIVFTSESMPKRNLCFM